MRPSTILPLLLTCTAALPAQWTQSTPANSPSLRRAGAMAFDGTANRMLIYGGTSPSPSTVLNETWAFTANWTEVVTGAPARWGHRMVRNPINNRILTFGGRSPTISALNNDTMEWNGTTWVNVPAPNRPSPRFLYGMCFDPNREVYVMFGGRTATMGTVDETWEFNGVTWTEVNTATTPPAREEMMMEFDTSLNRVVMFGGCDDNTDTILGDTWVYDGNDWTQVLTSNCAGCPTPRVRMAAAFDTTRQRTIMFGGYAELPGGAREVVNDTWEFGGDQWAPITTPDAPSNSTETYHAFNPSTNRFVIFGGFGDAFSNATWQYAGTTTGLFSLYGNGCNTSVGEPTLTANPPTIGSALNLQFGNNPPEANAVIVILGFSNSNWMGIPLPFDLGLIGLGGCDLNASADILEVAPVIGGTATYPILLPNQPSLINVSIYTQGIPLGLAPFTFLGATKGGRALIGN